MALASFALSAVSRHDSTDRRQHLITRLASVPAFFLFRIISGLLLLKLSTNYLPVSGFAIFSQFMAFAALLNMIAVGGAQNGLIRQAAAAEDESALARAQTAALVIWGVAAPLLWLLIAISSRWISRILVGTTDHWWVVVAIAFIALVAGPGQIWCSILTGRKQVTSSLFAQAIGLLGSTIVAGWLIARGDPILATIGFASGSLITMAIAALRVSRMRLRLVMPGFAAAELRVLLRYSAAFAATTGYSSIMLFALRSFYRDYFGTASLGYWLAANRISDMSTQFLGLFMIQFFVPHLAMLDSEVARRALVMRCWMAGTAVMGSVVLVFAFASRPLVHIFLSNAFLPAIPAIRVYMIGDCLRVWACLAMYSAFARGRPGSYALIEIGTLTLMGALVVALTVAGEARAPFIGYAGAYAGAAIVISIVFLWRALPARTAP
jgi:O-antigen/teichoic acid export membrane protein